MKLYISKIVCYLKTCKNNKKIDMGIKEFFNKFAVLFCQYK
jgi:hypothetical protein